MSKLRITSANTVCHRLSEWCTDRRQTYFAPKSLLPRNNRKTYFSTCAASAELACGQQCWTWSGLRIAIQSDSALQNRIRIGLDFEKKLNRTRYGYPKCIDHCSKMFNQSFFGCKPDWIKYFDRPNRLASDRIIERKFWTGLGFQKSPICSTLVVSHRKRHQRIL